MNDQLGVVQLPPLPPDGMRHRCQNCRFFDGGWCLRHAPVLNQVDPSVYGRWPVVLAGNWCGDWQWNEKVSE